VVPSRLRPGSPVRSRAHLAAAATVLLLTGCDGDGQLSSSSGFTAPEPLPPLAQYQECVSTAPVDSDDPDQPVLDLIGPRVVDHALGTPYVDQGATASSPRDGDISDQIRVTGLTELDPGVVGDYLIRYNVTDGAQLRAVEVVRLVRVNDGAYPVQTVREMGTTSARMGYYEHLPATYADELDQKFPLLVFIHGWGNARFLNFQKVQAPLSILEASNLVKLINDGAWDDSLPFIVLSPQKCYDGLSLGSTAARMKRFIDYAINTYKVDVSRLYMSGHSQGAGDTWDYVVNYPRQLAAVVPISGGYGTTSGCALKDTPAWAFNGQADSTVSYRNQVDTVGSINACDPAEPAKVTVFPSIGHNDIQARVLDLTGLGSGLPQYSPYDQSVYDWLLQHRRP
jgi:predicted esterase